MIYRLADLESASSATRRNIQAWTQYGALQPLPGTSGKGTGAHRAYDKRELVIACVLAQLGHQGVTGLYIVGAARILRALLDDPSQWRTVELAVRKHGQNFIVFNGLYANGHAMMLSSSLNPDASLFSMFDHGRHGLTNCATIIVDFIRREWRLHPACAEATVIIDPAVARPDACRKRSVRPFLSCRTTPLPCPDNCEYGRESADMRL